MKRVKMNEKGQMVAPVTRRMTADDFENKDGTSIYWLGGGGAMINSRGTIIMIDPVLEGFDMPLLIETPILPQEVPKVDAPNEEAFNGNPQNVIDHVVNPERVIVLAPGEEYKIQ